MATSAGHSAPIEAAHSDKALLTELAAVLERLPFEHALVGPDDAHIRLPQSLYRALRDAVKILETGDAVVVSPLHRRLTTTEASEILGVSRQYLTRLIDRGDIACERVGRHRRIRLADLLAFKSKRDHERREALDLLTLEAAESGAYG